MKIFTKVFYFPLLFLILFATNVYGVAEYSCDGEGENVLNINGATTDAVMQYSEDTNGAGKARYFKFQPLSGGEMTISYGQNGSLTEEKQTLKIGTTCGDNNIYSQVSGKTSDTITFYVSEGSTYYVEIKEKNGADALRFTVDFNFKAIKIGFEQATYNILEDVNIVEGLSSILPMKIVLTHPTTFDISVTYSTSDGTATAGSDYTAVTDTITIPAGDTEADIFIDIFHDPAIELDEYFSLTLSSLTPADGTVSYDITPTQVIILEQLEFPICYEDDFETSLDSKWRTLFSSGSFNPQIVNGRLRLTPGERDIATAVTKDYEFISQENVIIVEFEQFAYGGCGASHEGLGTYGADGIVAVLYDSSVGASPTPGSFGGSMGYAQRTGVDGFEGGWLGLGIDEYGNYANCNEGRVGGLPDTSCDSENGFSAQTQTNYASIRGDAGSNYKFLAASNQLLTNPVAVKSSSSAAPAHKYKFTADARDPAHLYISLQRDINDGNGYQFLINEFDSKDPTYGQTTTPDYVRFAFTSGTGGGCNNHEIDELKVYGNCRAYNPEPPSSIASQADIVNNFVSSTFYNDGTKYITTKVAAKTEEITGVYLNDSGNSDTYTSVNANLKFRIIPYLSDANCTTREVIRDTDGNPAVISIGTGETSSSIDIVMPAKATKDSRFIITALDFNKVYLESAKSCVLNSSTTGNLQGVGQCVNAVNQYEWAFGNDSYQRCVVNNGSPCLATNHGVGDAPYDNSYGCLMCTLDANSTCSSDNFAIRPDKFVLSTSHEDFPDLLRSGKDYNLTIYAYDDGISSGTDTTDDYNVIDADNNLTITETLLLKDGSPATIGELNGSPSFTADFNMTNGISTNGGASNEVAAITFDDVGRVIIKIEDREWASVDIDDVKYVNDATDNNCSGAYICGELLTRFIPHHFSFTDINITNNNGWPGTFTYISNLDDTNISTFDMAARIQVTIVAKNESNETTKNFDSTTNFYENPISVNSVASHSIHGDANTTSIPTALLGGFSNGEKTVAWNESNRSQVLRFNFTREVNASINPFVVKASDVNLSACSIYTGTASPDANITGAENGLGDGNTTMVYGRTHASRQRYEVPTDAPYRANIYYEVYCFGTDTSGAPGVTCDTGLLNLISPALQRTDDIRWFINAKHNLSADGNITNDNVTEIAPNNYVTEVFPNRDESVNHISNVELDYNGTRGYPYKTTMENNASNWLIYNEDDPTATRNQFSVEFNQAGTWSGERETTTTTKDPGTATTNRRSMW